MTEVKFKPWVGLNYGSKGLFAKRILILGESVYQGDPNKPLEKTNDIENIAEQIHPGKTFTWKFWTNIAIAFLNKRPSKQEKGEFWHSVMFYNYIRDPVGNSSRQRPTKEMWTDTGADTALTEVLGEHEPQYIVVLGYANWHNLSRRQSENGPTVIGAGRPETRWYSLGKGRPKALAYAMMHPSSRFSGWREHPFLKQAISHGSLA